MMPASIPARMNRDETDALPLSSSPTVAARLIAYEHAAAGAFAGNTARAIRSDLRVFTQWCAGAGASSELPVEPETAAAFIDAMAETRKPATVERYVVSLNHLHRAAGVMPPGAAEVVRLALKRMRRAKGTRQRQAAPLRRLAVDRILEAIQPDPLGLRDAALIGLAYDTLCRRSELAALDVRDIEPAEDGTATAIIARSKTDQEGEGAAVFVSADTMRRLTAWIAAAGLEPADPLFVPLGRASTAERLSGADVARIFKRRAAAAGLPAETISGHSTRVGAAQDMRASGIDNGAIMQAGRWKGERMVSRYTERLGARYGAAAKLAEMQGR